MSKTGRSPSSVGKAVTIADAIETAKLWQAFDSVEHQDFKQAAHVFSYALMMLDLERQAVHKLITEVIGYEDEPLYQRVERLAERWR